MKLYISFIVVLLLSASVMAAPSTSVSGTVKDGNNQGVIGATVTVNCEHQGINTTKVVQTDNTGAYYAFYPSLKCNVADNVYISAEKDGQSNVGQGIIAYDQTCKINTAFIDITIPEFGLVGGAVILAGLVVGVTLLRKKI